MQELKTRFYELRQDPIFPWSWRICLMVLAIGVFSLLFFWHKLPREVPFFYSLPWGEEQLTSPFTLITSIAVALGLYILSTLSAIFVHRTSPYLAKMLLIGTTAICILLIISIIQVILLIS